MINVTFYMQRSDFKGFEFSGHSDYSEIGTDIVCAAVSSAVYLVANTLTDSFGVNAYVTASDGYMKLTTEEADISNSVLKGLYQHMLQLQEQYNKDIKVKITEV